MARGKGKKGNGKKERKRQPKKGDIEIGYCLWVFKRETPLAKIMWLSEKMSEEDAEDRYLDVHLGVCPETGNNTIALSSLLRVGENPHQFGREANELFREISGTDFFEVETFEVSYGNSLELIGSSAILYCH